MKNKANQILFVVLFTFFYTLITLSLSNGKITETINQVNFGFIIGAFNRFKSTEKIK